MNAGFLREGEFWRLITAAFFHLDIIHLGCNMYALYVLGEQIETILGKKKFIFVYFISAIIGNLLSGAINGQQISSIGASGAIFGLMGALVYFGYHYRLYLGNVVIGQIAPVIIINLALSIAIPGIDIWGHVGGLIGGILATMIVGVEGKSDKTDRINGSIVTAIIIGLLIFVIFNPR
jgi:rhomboid protease GluP